MKRFAWLVLGGLAVAGVAACGGGPKPQTPAPQPNADSAAAAEQARRDSIERARQDSIARAMAEAERNRRQREADSLAALGRGAEAVRTLLATLIHFDFDKANIRAEDAAVLDQKIAIFARERGKAPGGCADGSVQSLPVRAVRQHGDGSRLQRFPRA